MKPDNSNCVVMKRYLEELNHKRRYKGKKDGRNTCQIYEETEFVLRSFL